MDFLLYKLKKERQKKWQECMEDKDVNFVYGHYLWESGGWGVHKLMFLSPISNFESPQTQTNLGNIFYFSS